jgi:L-iditol 2-dehydrogenase
MRREVSLMGTWNSDYSVAGNDDDWRTVLAAMAAKQLNLSLLITHRVKLDQAIATLNAMRSGSMFFSKVLFYT